MYLYMYFYMYMTVLYLAVNAQNDQTTAFVSG